MNKDAYISGYQENLKENMRNLKSYVDQVINILKILAIADTVNLHADIFPNIRHRNLYLPQ